MPRLIDADALMKEFAEFVAPSNNSDFIAPPNWNDAVSLLDSAPTIDPVKHEPLTDKEKRIFLAAMYKERKVCEEVDKNICREAYEDSLVWICKEIERKVKGALWTI